MSLDISALFAEAKSLVDQAVDTAGTSLVLGDVTEEIDGREVSETFTHEWVGPGLITQAGPKEVMLAPGFDIKLGDWIITVKAAAPQPAAGQTVEVTSSLNTYLEGKRGEVLGSKRDSSGAYALWYVRPAT